MWFEELDYFWKKGITLEMCGSVKIKRQLIAKLNDKKLNEVVGFCPHLDTNGLPILNSFEFKLYTIWKPILKKKTDLTTLW